MASTKDIYEADVYSANIFAAGVFRGTGVEPAAVPMGRVAWTAPKRGQLLAPTREAFQAKSRAAFTAEENN